MREKIRSRFRIRKICVSSARTYHSVRLRAHVVHVTITIILPDDSFVGNGYRRTERLRALTDWRTFERRRVGERSEKEMVLLLYTTKE